MNERWDFFKTGIIIWNACCRAEKLFLFILEYNFFPSQNLQLLKKEKILLGFWDYKGWTEEDLLAVKEGTQQVLHIHFFWLTQDWDFEILCLQSGARVLAFDRHHAVLVVSKPSPNQLFPGFGIVKVNIHGNYFITHFKARIRGCAFHEPNLTHWIKYMKNSESGWFKNGYFNFKQLAVLPAWPSWEFWL